MTLASPRRLLAVVVACCLAVAGLVVVARPAAAVPDAATVTAAPNPAMAGDAVTYTFEVHTARPPASGDAYRMLDNGTTVCSGPMTLTFVALEHYTGQASCTVTAGGAGTHTITGRFDSGLPLVGDVVGSTSLSVQPPLELTSSANPAFVGAPVTFSARFPGLGARSGTFTFASGATALCDAVGDGGDGVAECTTSFPAEGTYPVTVSYSGDPTTLADTASLSLVVTTDPLVVAISTTTPTVGEPVTITITQEPVAPGADERHLSVYTAFPSTTYCEWFWFPAAGYPDEVPNPATCTITFPAPGQYPVRVSLQDWPDPDTGSVSRWVFEDHLFTVSEATVVDVPPTLAGDPPDGVVAEPYAYTLTTTGTPAPVVTVATGTLPPGLSLASDGTVAGTPTAAGTFTATLQADNGVAPPATLEVSLTVGEAPTSTTVVAAPDPALAGDVVTYTATTTPAPTGGTVAFTDGGAVASGCGAVPIVAGSATCTAPAGGIGPHTIGATFGGAPGYLASSGTATTTVLPVPPTLAGDPPDGAIGASYEYAFTVTGTPAPTVAVVVGSLPPGLALASDGTLTGTPTAAGTFAATLRADNGTTPATLDVTVTVAARQGVSIGDARVVEGRDGTCGATFEVRLRRPSSHPVSVAWSTRSGSATPGQDFAAASGTVTFAPGTVSASVVVPVLGDGSSEWDETFRVELADAVGAPIERSSGYGVVLDDDGGRRNEVAVGDVVVVEGDEGTGAAHVTVSLAQAVATPTIVTIRTEGVGSAGPADYTARTATITIPAGSRTATFAVTIHGDRTVELPELFLVRAVRATGGVTRIGRELGYVAILGDDR
jgi:hypothetical protein